MGEAKAKKDFIIHNRKLSNDFRKIQKANVYYVKNLRQELLGYYRFFTTEDIKDSLIHFTIKLEQTKQKGIMLSYLSMGIAIILGLFSIFISTVVSKGPDAKLGEQGEYLINVTTWILSFLIALAFYHLMTGYYKIKKEVLYVELLKDIISSREETQTKDLSKKTKPSK
ncbi:hypothetical protein [Paenibacillus endoradicis]|uniref:hypothetical protein n=1 Tax=Paenibacillus endoradicis TaxID=2972487 RepID=UPI002158F8AE|nr:hypothetical protein [Paenibacillus endoradicis]MCR8656949.1 hypothetical protein [Paenibacillus endoradicis]